MSLKSFGDVLTALSPEKLEVLKAALRTHVELLSSPTSADRDADPAQAGADLVLAQEMLRDMESSDSAPKVAPHDSYFGQAPGDDVWPRAIKVAVIASDSWGSPTFLMSEHVVTEEEYDNGEHYERAKEEAYDQDYEGPMSAFDSRDFASRQIVQLLAFFGKERQVPVESYGSSADQAPQDDQAVKFVAQVAGMKVWDYDDMNECDEPSDGWLDSHCALMDLILEARNIKKQNPQFVVGEVMQGIRKSTSESSWAVTLTMESGAKFDWTGDADDQGHAEGQAIADAVAKTGEQVLQVVAVTKFGQAPGDDVWPRAIKVAVIASDSWGSPTFLMSEHVVTEEEYDNGEHYERAKEEAGEKEYEGPMSAFDSRDFASRQIGQLLAFFGRERQIPVDSPEIKAESSASAEVPDSDLPPDDSEDCQNQSPG